MEWLGRMGYREAWRRQRQLAAARADGHVSDTLLLVEHEPVLTLGRHADPAFVRAEPRALADRGVEVIRVERGGEVTYHGPGQLVAYPIVHLARAGLLLRPFVRALETAMIETAAAYAVESARRDGYPGTWCFVASGAGNLRKLGCLGLRVERGVTYHGIALNVATDLADFALIDPCGLAGVEVTSIARERGWRDIDPRAATELVEEAGATFATAFHRAIIPAAKAGQPVAA